MDGNPAAGNGSRVVRFEPKNTTSPPERATVGQGFTEARPQRLDTAGMARHPGSIVEPDSLASVVPPKITYRPMLDDVIKGGLISDLQAEPVIYAGQRHEQTLPGGQRAGYLVGDGTGVGKGRTLAAIALDNNRQGRKKTMWVSVGWTLASQVRGDMKNVGGGDIPFLRLDDYGPADDIKASEGILFTTYSTFKQKERYEQLKKWLGEEPVILFDEAHQAKNLVTDQGEPTAVGLAVQKIQDETPQARVVYASATSATEPKDMAYMNRLGLWGVGTAFPKFNDFRSALDAGGVGAMEMASRDMKALGLGVARALSMKDVQFQKTEHELTPEQTEMYDKSATVWQKILENIDDAIDQTQGGSRARARAMSQFYSAMQRFFKQIASSYKVPTLIKRIEEEIADGKSVVVRFVSTAQGAVEEQVANARAEGRDLEDLDLTPRDTIANYLEKSFPTTLYEEYTDPDTGMKITRPVLDANGEEVQDPDAVAMRDELMRQISDISLPDTALDQLIRHFGVKAVAEVTGRTKQLVVDDATGKRKYLSRSPKAANPAERDAFQAGKKRILLMNDAGGTGMDAHASNDFKNRQQRVYFIYETGWSADKEMQGLGRVNRTNQASAPIYDLLHTNLPGERRFMSTIARRLGQLGALTRGERSATKAGGLSDYDFENEYGKAAVAATYRELEPDVIRRMGFQKKGQVVLKDADRTDVPKFLNRVLALQVKLQEEAFAIFEKNLESAIAAAKANGQFDEGVSDIKAESIQQVGKETRVHTDPGSGAETNHVELEAKIKTKPIGWSEVGKDEDYTFFTNNQSGRVFAVDLTRRHERTNTETGRVEGFHPAKRPNGTHESIPWSYLYGFNTARYTETARTGAQPLWQKEFDDTPKFRTERLHYITGATLPIWDKLKAASKDSGRLKVERAITDDGQRVIGVRIPSKSVSEVLKAMNIKTKASDSMEVFQSVLENGQTIQLDKGLSLQRSMVGREPRIEVAGVDARTGKLLAETFGLSEEKIQWKYRYFIPTNEQAAKPILDKFLKAYPAIDAEAETKKFATAEEAPGAPVTLETVRKAIPGLRWTEGAQVGERWDAGAFSANLRDGRVLVVSPTASRFLSVGNAPGFEASRRAGGLGPRAAAVGTYAPFGLSKKALIQISEAAPDGTVEHEGLHFLWDVALTPDEKAALVKKYGGEEEAAYAFAKWLTDRNRRPSNFFQKVLDWVRRLVHYFRPTWETTFGEAASGRAAQRVVESTGRGGFAVDEGMRQWEASRVPEPATDLPATLPAAIDQLYDEGLTKRQAIDRLRVRWGGDTMKDMVYAKWGQNPVKPPGPADVLPFKKPEAKYATFTPARKPEPEPAETEPPKPQKPRIGRPLPSGPGRALRVGPMDVDDLTRRVIAARDGEGTPGGVPVEQMNHPEFHNNFRRVLQVLPKEDAEWFARLYDAFKPEFKTVSAKLTWEQGDHEALKLLNIYDREQFLQAMQRGVIFNEPGLRAATRIMYEVEAENKDAIAALRQAQDEGRGGPDSDEYRKVAETSVNVAAWALAIRGEKNEAGRAFNARKNLQGARTDSEKLVGRMFKEIGGLTEEQAAKAVAMANQNPEKLPDLMRKMFKPSFWDYINEYRKASMLSSVRTYGVNFFGNAMKQLMTLSEIPLAAGIDAARSLATGDERQVYMGEVAAARAGLSKYGPAHLKRFVTQTQEALKGVERFDPDDSRPYEMQVGVIPGAAGKAIRTIFRLMQAADNFFKATAETQALYREAYRRARNEGLTGDNAAKRVDDLIAIGEGSEWTDRRVAGMKEKARRAAQYETFTLPANWENSGAFGLMANLVSQAEKKFKPVGLFVPFKGTPANIAYQSFERSPLGLWAVKNRFAELSQLKRQVDATTSPAEKKRLEGELNRKAEEFANQFARAAMGSAVFSVAVAMALAGNLTGSGPADPDKRRVWQNAGKIPTAIKVGDSDWYAYDRFEPAAAAVALAANIPMVASEEGAQKKFAAFVNAMQDAWVSKTYLQGLEQLADVMTDPSRYSQKWLRDLTGSFVPAFLGQATEAVDPTVRDTTGGLLDPLKARIPGLSDALPVTRTGTGEPASRTGRLGGGGPLNPFGFIRKGSSKGDPLFKEFEQAGYAPDPHNRYIMVGVGPTGRKVQHRVDLTPQELELFRRADEAVTARLREMIKRPEWRDLDPTIKKQEFSKLYARGSNRVRAAILPRVAARLRERLGGADAR